MEQKVYEDVMLVCKDCNSEYQFTKGEQEFFETKSFPSPIRCPNCRKAKKDRLAKRNSEEQRQKE